MRSALLIGFILGFGIVPAQAAEIAVAEAIAVRGDVTVESGAAKNPLVLRQALHRGDMVVSGAGKAKILLNDGSIVSLGENSRLRLADYGGTGATLGTRLFLVGGVLRLFVNRTAAGGSFEVESETATAAVRGTDWLIEAVPERTSVAVLHGSVAVSGTGAHASETVLLDAPGLGVDVPRGAAPGAVHPWSKQRFDATLRRASFD
jgi:hypothetical protein